VNLSPSGKNQLLGVNFSPSFGRRCYGARKKRGRLRGKINPECPDATGDRGLTGRIGQLLPAKMTRIAATNCTSEPGRATPAHRSASRRPIEGLEPRELPFERDAALCRVDRASERPASRKTSAW